MIAAFHARSLMAVATVFIGNGGVAAQDAPETVDAAAGRPEARVGSKTFTESVILGELAALHCRRFFFSLMGLSSVATTAPPSAVNPRPL